MCVVGDNFEKGVSGACIDIGWFMNILCITTVTHYLFVLLLCPFFLPLDEINDEMQILCYHTPHVAYS